MCVCVCVREKGNLGKVNESRLRSLADNQQVIVRELVVGDLQIQGSRSLADTSGRIVVRAMARTIVASPIASIGNWYTAQVSADSDDHQPSGLFDSFLQLKNKQCSSPQNIFDYLKWTHAIKLGITQTAGCNALLGGNLGFSPVTDEQRFSAPLERHRFALGDVAQLNFDLGQGQHISRGAHRRHELVDDRLGGVSSCDRGSCGIQIEQS